MKLFVLENFIKLIYSSIKKSRGRSDVRFFLFSFTHAFVAFSLVHFCLGVGTLILMRYSFKEFHSFHSNKKSLLYFIYCGKEST
jgi:hypothetical protein